MSSMDYNAVLFTPLHSVTGIVSAKEQRLSDLLNDPRESVVRLRNAKLYRQSEPGRVIAEHAVAFIPKEEIAIAFEPVPREDLSPKRLYSFVRKQQNQVFIVMDGFEVSGVLHTLSQMESFDIHDLIAGRKVMFLPVTQAQVIFATDDRYLIKREAIIVNVQHIHYIAKAEA